MNWLQKFGVGFLVLSAAVAGATWGTYVNHAVNPVAIADLGLTPEAAAETREYVAGLQPLQVLGADGDDDNRAKRVTLGAAVFEANGGQWPWTGPQEIGDCTSMGTARAVELDTAQAIKNGAPLVWRPVFRPWIYYGGRIRNGKVQISGDGAVPSWAVEWIGPEPKGKGIVWADESGVPEYNGQVAKQFGRNGPPQDFYEKASPYRVNGAAAINSAQDACNAITSGYPVVFGSMRWGTNSIKLVEGRNVARDTANWPHTECASGYDGTSQTYGAKGLFYIDNSWGPEAHNPKSQMPGDQPGGYYVTWADMDAICKEGMAFSISGTQGFPKRELDFSDFGVVAMKADAADQGATMFASVEIDPTIGYGFAFALLIIGVLFLIAGRIRGNVFRHAGLTAMLVLAAIQTSTAADISFAAFDGKSTSTSSTASSEPVALSFAAFNTDPQGEPKCKLSFGAFGCKCGPGCDCVDCENCNCSKRAIAAEPPARRVQWLMFSTPGCVPCEVSKTDYRTWFERSGWEVSPTPMAHIRLIDAELDAPLVDQFRVRKFPTFVLTRDGKEIDRHESYPGRDHLASKLIQAVKEMPPEPKQAPPPPKEQAVRNGTVEVDFKPKRNMQ